MPWVEVICAMLSIDTSTRLSTPQALETNQLVQLHSLFTNVQKAYEHIHCIRSPL